MINILDEKKLFITIDFNTKFVIILVKMASCPACIRFLPNWSKLSEDPELVGDIAFLTLERFDKDDAKIIDQIDNYKNQYYYNSPEIIGFPTILIFKQDIDKKDYEFYENFQLSRRYLKTYLKELINHYRH